MKNTTIVLFGATGDLAKRKIIPALYRLVAKEKLGKVIVIGAAFSDVTSDQMIDAAQPFVAQGDKQVWDALRGNSYYKKIDFSRSEDFVDLHAFVQACEKKQGMVNPNRLFYVATGSNFFCHITHAIGSTGLAVRCDQKKTVWHRIVYEKPFGHDVVSAHEINECIKQWFDEHQVYRIDHYLSKELVSNIAMIRFTNCVFEPLWSNRYIDHIQIMLSESGGIEDRGVYYDAFGALADVVQNHMLELVALLCMETPEKLTGDFIRAERVKILEKVRFIDGILGQYEGYHKEKHVRPDSHTETYAFLKFAIDTPRWAGVPFYLKTGKCLDKKETVIHIKFKQVDCLLIRGCPTESNWLTIKIGPDAVFSLTLNIKKPMVMDQVVPVDMEFCHSCIFGLQTPEAYEILLEEVMRGEQSISVRFDEIECAWKVIDAIKQRALPLYRYTQGSTGPQEEQDYIQKHGIRWRS